MWDRIALRTRQHVVLVAVSLGVVASRRRVLGQAILSVTGLLQTIPSLALLVLMIPLLGIGGPPALVAPFLYSLLPIVRNTREGLVNIDPALTDRAVCAAAPRARPRSRLPGVDAHSSRSPPARCPGSQCP